MGEASRAHFQNSGARSSNKKRPGFWKKAHRFESKPHRSNSHVLGEEEEGKGEEKMRMGENTKAQGRNKKEVGREQKGPGRKEIGSFVKQSASLFEENGHLLKWNVPFSRSGRALLERSRLFAREDAPMLAGEGWEVVVDGPLTGAIERRRTVLVASRARSRLLR